MSAKVCLDDLVREGKIDPRRAKRLRDEFDRLERGYAKGLGASGGAQAATDALLDRAAAEAVQRRRVKLGTLATQRLILSAYEAVLANGGDGRAFMRAMLSQDERAAGVTSVENRRTALRQQAWSMMTDLLAAQKRNLVGEIRDRALADDLVRELKGEVTGNANAKELAGSTARVFEWMRQTANEAGASIGKLADWGLPHIHDAVRVGNAGFDEWRAFLQGRIDPARMVDGVTGKPLTTDELEAGLDRMWHNISSEGLDSATPGAMRGQAVAERHADHRWLVFKDADAWLEYNERFGSADAYSTITGHIDTMARDIAAMQLFGADAASTVRWMGGIVEKDAAPTRQSGRNAKSIKQAKRAAREIDLMWRMYTGELNVPVSREVARFFSGMRNWNVATKLGSATLSAMTSDPVFAGMTAKFNGLSVTRLTGDYLSLMDPTNPAHRATAEHAGLIFSEMTHRTEKLWREDTTMRLNAHEVTRRAAETVLNVSLLTPHTVAMRQALGLGFMRDWANLRGAKFGELAEASRLSLERYGIDEAAWDVVRATVPMERGGVSIIDPGDVWNAGAAGQAASLKLRELIAGETRFGVPGESLRAQTAVATLFGGLDVRRGTVGGELIHSATQFKTFSVIAMMTHWQRAMYGRGGMSGSAYGISTLLLLTMGGYAALGLKAISNGQDAPSMADPRTLPRALVQGGGLGIVGDFIAAGATGQEKTTVPGFLLGPSMAAVVDPLVRLTLGNASQGVNNLVDPTRAKDTNAQREAWRFARDNLPGGNIWFAKLALNRLILDEIERIADPKYEDAWARTAKRGADNGQPFYSLPGTGYDGTARAPDLSSMTRVRDPREATGGSTTP